jgi:hypothetical protein
MPFVNIIKPEKGHFWGAIGDQVNDKLFKPVPLSWSVEKLDSLPFGCFVFFYTETCLIIYKNLYIIIQIFLALL